MTPSYPARWSIMCWRSQVELRCGHAAHRATQATESYCSHHRIKPERVVDNKFRNKDIGQNIIVIYNLYITQFMCVLQ